MKAYFGDATRPDLLEAAGIRDASHFIVAIDEKNQSTQLVRYVRLNNPKEHVIARAHDRNHVYDLYAAGCRDIIRETFDSSVRKGKSAFTALGMSEEDADRATAGFVADDRTHMIVMADVYDSDITLVENTEYVNKAKEIADIHTQLMEEGPTGFGKLADKLTELGSDPSEIVKQY